MKNLMCVLAMLSLAACEQAPTSPTLTNATIGLASTRMADTASSDNYHGPLPLTLPPSPPYCTPATPDPQPPSCDWRDMVVCQHIALGGKTNDIVTLANGHRVYIVDTGYAPGYRLEDYPVSWCSK